MLKPEVLTPIRFTRGDKRTFVVGVKQRPLATGDTVTMTVRRYVNSPDILMQKVVTEFVEGKAHLYVKNADTKDIPFGNYIYDIQVTEPDGEPVTIFKGDFILTWEATYD